MSSVKSLLFSHNHHLLSVKGCEAGLDVLAFEGDEALSQPFRYRIEFTSADHAIGKEMMLMKAVSLTLQASVAQGFGINVQQPVRVIQGVVTGFERLSTSRDETHYALTLQPRLALLNRSHQNAIYQDQSVPQIVEKILRERHGLRGQDFLFSLTKTYPRREQVMQYGEDDLRFITRLLGEVGIWFRFTADTRLHIDVAEFCDSQQGYEKGLTLPSVPPSGQQSAGVDAVWEMACRHRVVEQQVSTRDYNYREATADMNAQVDVTRGETTTFGEAYHWGDNYLTAGNVHDRHPAPESGAFYARLRHERYLNGQTRMQATTSCPTLCPGQVLKVTGGEEVAGEFADGVLVTAMHSHARRDADFAVEFAGIPDSPDVGYRPEPGARPVMAGTLPARVTSTRENDTYGHIDKHGRYRVNMLFDRARWETGFESLWVRQSRPYAGDTYGLHLPLLAGTEVAIGFEDGNPDRPYIAGVLHDSAHGDHVTIRNDKRNVLRTPANNKIRLDDERGIHWRRKVRLLLVTGDEAAIEQLVPGLRQQHWLEGNRTVLIYGGSLASEPDREKYIALRKLRRGRPLDGIVRVMPSSLTLTPQISESDLHGLEKISELLGYAAPVWLWKLCDSEWPQADRAVQAVGVSFPLRATEDDVARQLAQMLPTLREQGMRQIAEETRHDFLLRLGQQLIDGGIAQWRWQLAPWLTASRQRLALRGLMFSLPEPRTVDPYQEADTSPAGQPHLLTLPATWLGIVDDCRRLRGHHVGMAWERGLACGLLAILGLWAAGLLLSFALNYSQIASVAGKARDLVAHPSVSDYQLTALHALRNEAGRLVHDGQKGAPWYRRFGLDHHQQLLNAVLPWYGVANHRLIRDPANAALQQALSALVNSAPNSDQRAQLAKPGYDQLKAWLMMARPDKADGAFFAQTMKTVQPTRMGISTGLWQSLAPDLWAFYLSLLPERPEWKIIPDAQRVSQSRQVLLQQLGRRNAESTLYENMLKSVRRNFADVSLEDMTSGTDARRLFTTDEVVPGMFTRQAWEGGIQQAIDKAASSRREEIDWVLSDSRKTVSTDLSPEALKARLTRRYFTDFAGSWLNFLNSLRLNPATTIADVTDQLTLISDVRQSPLIALMNTLAWQGQAGQQREGLSDSLIKSAKDLVGGKDKPVIDQSAAGPQGPLDDTFGPLLQLMGKNTGSNVMSADSTLSLQTYLTRITRVRLRLQQVANASDPQEMMQVLAQTVFQGKSVDLTDTQQYGSLISASLGEEWSGFGNTLFVQPLTQAWETVLLPSAASLNDKWRRSVVANWHTAFDGRFPFAASKSDASLPMLAEFVRKDSGRIERFLTTELNGVLHKEGSQWVPDKVNSHGLVFNPAFLRAINQLSQLSDILFTDGSQGISFELQARPAPEVVETQLTIDGQKLRYFNQMADWQTFRWPGETYKPGTLLTWTTVNAGTRLFGDYSGTWGFIRWLEQGKRHPLDRSQWMMSFSAPDGRTLQWVLRSQLGSGPLALLALRGLTLPDQIFTVDAAESAQALTTGLGNSDMDEMEL